MRKLILTGLAALAATALVAGPAVAAEATDKPKAQTVECKEGQELAGNGHLTLSGDSATASFTVKVGCSFVGGFDSWELPEPVYSEPQIQHDRKAGTYGPGEHTLTVAKPRCWQLDLYRGVQPEGDWQYGNRLLASHIGGTKPCKDEPKEETPPVEEEPPAEEQPPVDEPKKDEPIAGTATSKKRAEPNPDDSIPAPAPETPRPNYTPPEFNGSTGPTPFAG